MTPTSTTSTPSAARPAARADWIIVPERRVSRPRRKGAPGTIRAAARPRARASSAVSSEPATPRIPSVPNRGAIGAQRFEY